MYFALIFHPIITMRCFSEEYQNGTLELMLAYGVSETNFVLAKFLFSNHRSGLDDCG